MAYSISGPQSCLNTGSGARTSGLTTGYDLLPTPQLSSVLTHFVRSSKNLTNFQGMSKFFQKEQVRAMLTLLSRITCKNVYTAKLSITTQARPGFQGEWVNSPIDGTHTVHRSTAQTSQCYRFGTPAHHNTMAARMTPHSITPSQARSSSSSPRTRKCCVLCSPSLQSSHFWARCSWSSWPFSG
jgi:hypothetical protein